MIQNLAKMKLFAVMTPTTSPSITVNVKGGLLAKTVKVITVTKHIPAIPFYLILYVQSLSYMLKTRLLSYK